MVKPMEFNKGKISVNSTGNIVFEPIFGWRSLMERTLLVPMSVVAIRIKIPHNMENAKKKIE